MRQDAFTHLPQLRDRVTPAEKSELRATVEVLAAWDQRARDAGFPVNWRVGDQQLDISRQAILGSLDPAEDLWVFAYGGLMWDPGIHFEEIRLADLAGHVRRFSHKNTIGRGSAEHPALMLTLEEGAGSCAGLAFRVEASAADFEAAIVWRREMLWDDYRPQLMQVSTPQGDVKALVFRANKGHPNYFGEHPLDETAAMIAVAKGEIGSNRDYLLQVAAQLDRLGIEDRYVQELAARVQLLG